jgi:signal transduction histidine kinase
MLEDQNRFVSDASHELRTPLTSLKLSMEVFLRDKHANLPEAKKLITSSIGEVDRLHYLSENLLELSKFNHNQPTVKVEKIPLSEVIDSAIVKVTPQLTEKQIEVKVEKITQKVKVDRHEMTDLLVILLDNAIKYSKNKSKIDIKIAKKSRHLDLHIIDEGAGIAKKDLPFIFDRFYRADSARVKGGYGLGLSIAKKIANKNGILILVKSAVGVGTDFTIRFSS